MQVIVGGGVSGLAVAHELRRRDPRAPVRVLEAADRPGGVLRSERVDGYLCEWAANAFLGNAVGGAVDLARELGVELIDASPEARRRWIWRGDRLREVPTSPPALLRTDLLSWRGKLRLLAEPIVRRGEGEETVAAFARRRLGAEAAEALVAPFVLGIFAGEADRLSASAAFPRLWEMEARHGSLVRALIAARKGGAGRPPRLVAPRAGASALTDALAARLRDAVSTGARVVGLERRAGSWRLALAGGDAVEAERVALALPPSDAAALVRPHDAGLADVLGGVRAVDVAVAFVGVRPEDLRAPLDGFGFLVAAGERPRCLGCVFESTVWPDRAPVGRALLRLIYGGDRDPGAVALDDASLRAVVLEDLRATLGLVAEPSFFRVVRHRRAIPQYELGHAGRVADAEARARALGLVLCGNAFYGVAVNDCVRRAGAIASQLLEAA